ncbi:MAG: HAD family hydrolase [Planctomycetota bacterium]|jgi:phosphoglycolate phosphatase-like HAD superfamily hydrolase
MNSTNLAIFDIDGTLTEVRHQHDVCFVRAVTEILDAPDLSWNWSEYTHVTDEGIVFEAFERHRGRAPTDSERRRIQRRYVEELLVDGGGNRTLDGAQEFLAHLESLGWSVAMATGNWDAPARWKLEAAGIEPRWPLASSDDSMNRAEIIAAARDRAGPHAHAVYLGDGAWDQRAAGRAGVHFVAVGELEHEHRIADYRDLDHAVSQLGPI